MTLSFLSTVAVLVGVLAAAGQGFFAIWHCGPVTAILASLTVTSLLVPLLDRAGHRGPVDRSAPLRSSAPPYPFLTKLRAVAPLVAATVITVGALVHTVTLAFDDLLLLLLLLERGSSAG